MLITRWWGRAARRVQSRKGGGLTEIVETRWKMDYVVKMTLHALTDATCLKYRAVEQPGGMGIAAIVFTEAEMKLILRLLCRR